MHPRSNERRERSQSRREVTGRECGRYQVFLEAWNSSYVHPLALPVLACSSFPQSETCGEEVGGSADEGVFAFLIKRKLEEIRRVREPPRVSEYCLVGSAWLSSPIPARAETTSGLA